MKKSTEAQGWKTVNAVRTPLGAGDFSQYLTPVLSSGADVLILNHYGKDMVNSLTQAVQFGMRQKQVNGKNFEIVVPLFSELMAQGAGEAIKGIYGTANWDWKLDNDGTKAFVKSFGKEYGTPPSQAAQTAYAQAILYADACERAGTFFAPAVIKALEDFQFDGLGNGKTLYAAATTSASRTCWSCRARKAEGQVRPSRSQEDRACQGRDLRSRHLRRRSRSGRRQDLRLIPMSVRRGGLELRAAHER